MQVCPTGIDIRNGLQYECIGCGACADVCDTVMDKMGYARGLVRYSTEHAVSEHWGRAQILRHVLRPRVLVYSGILLAVVLAMLVSLGLRTPFKVDVVRDRGTLARIVQGGQIENVYRLQIMNATEQDLNFRVTASGIEGMRTLMDSPTVAVAATQARWVAVRVQIPYEAAAAGSHPIHFTLDNAETTDKVSDCLLYTSPSPRD